MPIEVFFKSCGLNCAADLYLPADYKPGEKRPGLVLGHGFTLVKGTLEPHARYFQAAGFIVLAIDYRTFGASEGEPRAQLLPLNEVEDFRNALSYLQARPEVDPARVGIWGASFAGALVSYVGAVDQRVKATCAMVPVTDGFLWMKLMRDRGTWEKLVQVMAADRERRYRGEPGGRLPVNGRIEDICALPTVDDDIRGFFNALKENFPTWCDTITIESIERIIEFSPLNMVERISPRPYLIISTSGYDVVHPADSIAELFHRAREPKRLVFLPYDQTQLYVEPGLSRANQTATEFFIEHLGAPR